MSIYKNFRNYLRSLSPFYYRKANRYKIPIKYVISGCTAAFVDLVLLCILIDVFKVYYLLSASIAFLAAFFISFYLQKFWTFRDNSNRRIYQQMFWYFSVGIVNLGINVAGMYILIEHIFTKFIYLGKFNITYILSQIMMGAFIAVGSFLVYKFVIFKKKKKALKESKNNKLKVLIATGIFPPDIGGPATYVKALREELPKLGCEVKVVTYGFARKQKTENRKQLYELFIVDREQNILFRYIRYFWQVFKLAGWADAVYVQGLVGEGLPSWFACRLRRKKYILKIVGNYAWEQGRQRFGVRELLDDFQNRKYGWQVELMRKIQRIVAHGAQKIITPSNYLKRIIQQWGIKDNKIKVIYNSVEKVDLHITHITKEEAKKELNLTGDIILSVGRLVRWKGFDLLIKLMPELLKINPNFKLVIIGGGPEKKTLELIIKKLKASNSIKLTGSLEQQELWRYMRVADMFVLNTGYEGLPHIIIEAMQIGIPVIASNVGGNPEVIENNKTGLLVEYNNKQQIRNAILELWKDKEKVEKLKNEAKINLSKFNKEKMINNTVQILKQL
ncbi:MAG: glycosyltransferase [Patescibacteria group bacterium]|nr:glycosyltransferase [Patescibacteria group bacterium]